MVKNKIFAVSIVLALIVLAAAITLSVPVATASEYNRYVTSVLNDPNLGNYTYLEKPGFPVYISNGSILIGQNYTIICPLQAGHSYHVYCYGAWINLGSNPKTDYNIYVYDPQGNLVSEHTQAAGLPEHLGTTVNDAYFVPQYTGNYSWVIVNDPRTSHGSEQATFMIIEHVDCDQWYSQYVEGYSGNTTQYYTNWAYDFTTNSSNIVIYVNVPQTLDMYEGRLYLMTGQTSFMLNNVPLPVETGLYGNGTGVGGYNMDTGTYQGVASASCEYHGQDTIINYTTTDTSTNTYHLVLMGETDSGTVNFMVKTNFNSSLTPISTPSAITPDKEAVVTYNASSANIENAVLNYSIDGWNTTKQLNMDLNGTVCNATIPQQMAGTLVQYTIAGVDVYENNLSASGNFTVKNLASFSDFTATSTLTVGSNVTFTGKISVPDAQVFITILSTRSVDNVTCIAKDDGSFSVTYKPQASGQYEVQASFLGDNKTYYGMSETSLVTVNEPSFTVKYGLYIGLGIIGAMAAICAVLFIRSRRE